jgi:hypothetical protein
LEREGKISSGALAAEVDALAGKKDAKKNTEADADKTDGKDGVSVDDVRQQTDAKESTGSAGSAPSHEEL